MKCKFATITNILEGLIAIILLVSTEHIYAGIDADWESEFTGPETFWGAETNGIKVALLINPLVSSNNVPIRCTPVIKSSIKGSNLLNTVNVFFPPMESRYQISLRDEKGNLVSKTAKCKALGKPITEPLMVKIGGINMRAGYSSEPLMQNHSEMLPTDSFNLQDYFVITNSGRFQLTYEMRVILPQKNKEYARMIYTKNFPTLTLPPVVVELELSTPTNSTHDANEK